MTNQKLPSSILLPEGLQYIKGGEGYTLYFESDIDKATYFLGRNATKTKKDSGINETLQSSEKKKQVWEWLREVTGWTEIERREHRNLILKEAKKLSNTSETGDVNIPNLFNKTKTTDAIEDEPEEELPPGLEDLLAEISGESKEEKVPPELESLLNEVLGSSEEKPAKKKQKKPRIRRTGQLTKRQEELLHNILSDLIKIKYRLVQIKKNQDDKIAYEKRRDRLQAERIAFAQREREIEALPQPVEKKTEHAANKIADSVKQTVGTSLLSGLASAILNFGSNQPATPGPEGAPGSPGAPGTPGASSGPDFTSFAKSALKVLPIPGISAIPFAEGGVIGPTGMLPFVNGSSITPIGSNGTTIQPLETAMGKSTSGGTTFSRGFSMDDLKSPLAEVMKLPLKVAGAALLSAISRLASQFDISDSKLQSDLSKMIGDVSKAFGLSRPTFGGISVTKQDLSITGDSDNEQGKLTLAINNVADSLVEPTEETPPNPPNPPSGAAATPPVTPSGTTGTSTTPPVTPSGTQARDTRSMEGGTTPESQRVIQDLVRGKNILLQNNGAQSSTPSSSSVASISGAPMDNISNSISLNKNNSTFSPSNTFTSNTSLNFTSPQRDISNSTYFDQVNELKFNPAGKPSTSISVAMGLPPIESIKELSMPSGVNIINLPTKYNTPQINKQESNERVIRTGKAPSGYTNVATSIRSQVLA